MTASTAPLDAATLNDDQIANTAPASLGRILVALDASEHANKALEEAIRLAKSADGVITGIHEPSNFLFGIAFGLVRFPTIIANDIWKNYLPLKWQGCMRKPTPREILNYSKR